MDEYSHEKYLECDGLLMAALLETNHSKEQPFYCTHSILALISEGMLTINIDGNEYIFPTGSMCFIPKDTRGKFSRSYHENEKKFKIIVFIFEDTLVKDVFKFVRTPSYNKNNVQSLQFTPLQLPQNGGLFGFMSSIYTYLKWQYKIDINFLRLKTVEALTVLVDAIPDLATVFLEYTNRMRVKLDTFMQFNITEKYTLPELAKASGRSITRFNRDFKEVFNQTPHQWIKEKRLQLARDILVKTNRKASEIYMELGFEDLGHFSKSFKKQFGVNPSQINAISNFFDK